MYIDQSMEIHKVFSMQSLQIASVYTLAILPEMGSCPVSHDICFSGGILFLKTGRIVANEIDPGAPPLSAGPNQRPIMTRRRETHLEKRVGQPLGIHLFIKLDEPPADIKSILKVYGELQFLVQMVDGTVEGLAAFQYKIGPLFNTVCQGRQRG